jgi:hypothetical protein
MQSESFADMDSPRNGEWSRATIRQLDCLQPQLCVVVFSLSCGNHQVAIAHVQHSKAESETSKQAGRRRFVTKTPDQRSKKADCENKVVEVTAGKFSAKTLVFYCPLLPAHTVRRSDGRLRGHELHMNIKHQGKATNLQPANSPAHHQQ